MLSHARRLWVAGLVLAACGASGASPEAPVSQERQDDPRQVERGVVHVRLIVPEAPAAWMRVEITGDFGVARVTLRAAVAAVGAYRPAPFGTFLGAPVAYDAGGAPLVVDGEPGAWTVEGGLSRFSYTIDAEAAEAALEDRTVANHRRDGYTFVSGYASFLVVEGAEARPHELHLELPDGWRVATALEASPDAPNTYLAANALELLDEPLAVGRDFHSLTVSDVDPPGLVHVYGAEADPAPQLQVVADAYRAAIRSAHAVGLPPMPRPYHVFVELLPPGDRLGWAMEHDHSTLLMYERGRLTEPDAGFTYHVVHEVLHAWIPRRLYTRSLRPDAQLAGTPTPHVWFAEGFEQYLAFVGAARSGALERDDVLVRMARRFARPYETAAPPVSVSIEAHSLRICQGDHEHWTWQFGAGGLLALQIDQQMRARGDGTRGLPEALAELVAGAPVAGIDDDLFVSRLSEVTGVDLSPMVARHLGGAEPLDVEAILAGAGVVRDGDAWVVSHTPSEAAARFVERAF